MTYMHVQDTHAEDLMTTVNELTARAGWKLVTVTLYSPFNAMEHAVYTAFLERDDTYDPGGAE